MGSTGVLCRPGMEGYHAQGYQAFDPVPAICPGEHARDLTDVSEDAPDRAYAPDCQDVAGAASGAYGPDPGPAPGPPG